MNNTNDSISRKAAIDALERIFDRCEEIEAHLPEGDPDRVGYKMYPDWLTVWKYLHQLPSAQPEVTEEAVKDYCRKRCLTILTNDYFHKLTSAQPEIIRCKDCLHWQHSVVRPNYCEVWDWCNNAEDFCSFVERKEDEIH